MLKQLVRITDHETIRYLIVGAMTTLVSTGTFLLLCEGLRWGVTLSNVLSILTAIAFAYVTNKKIVFRSLTKSPAEAAAEFFRFVSTRLFAMGVEVGGVYLLYNILRVHEVPAKILTQIVVIILNYVCGKFLVFRGASAGSGAETGHGGKHDTPHSPEPVSAQALPDSRTGGKKASVFGKPGRMDVRYVLIYSGVFAVTALLVFAVYYLNGRSLIWSHDGLRQHTRALLCYSDWLRGIIKSIVTGGGISVPSYSFSLGYGADILGTLHYYVIGDPIAALSVFVPRRFIIPWFYTFTIVLRYYLSGLVFSVYAFAMSRRVSRGSGGSAFSSTAVLAGAMVYTFSGFALFTGIRHPYFLMPMIFFPLIALGVERILDGKKAALFVLSVAAASLSNFYFFYMIAILTAIYAGIRLAGTYGGNRWKELFRKLGKLAASAALGTAMSAVILLPMICTFFHSSRGQESIKTDILPSAGSALSRAASFFSPAVIGQDWTVTGLAAICFVAVYLLFRQKGFRQLKAALLLLTGTMFLPIAGKMMNGFSYPVNRWLWGWCFLVAFILVVMWERMTEYRPTRREIPYFLVMASVFAVSTLLSVPVTIGVAFGAVMAMLSMGILMLPGTAVRTAMGPLLVFLIIASIAGNAWFLYADRFSGIETQFVLYKDLKAMMQRTDGMAVRDASAGDTGFFRYSGGEESLPSNSALLAGLHGTAFFWSLENGYITQFRDENGLTEEKVIHNFKSLDGRAMLNSLNSVRYYVRRKDAPYGFHKIGTYRGYTVWKTRMDLPFGFTVSGRIPEKRYRELPAEQKQEALLQGVVINGADAAPGREIVPKSTSRRVSYRIVSKKNAEVDSRGITAKKAGASIRIRFRTSKKRELYLKLRNLRWEPKQRTLRTLKVKKDTSKPSTQISSNWKRENSTKVLFTFEKGTNHSDSKKIVISTPYYKYHHYKKERLVCFSRASAGTHTITIRFQQPGRCTFRRLSVIAQPLKLWRRQTAVLCRDHLRNVDLHETGLMRATSRVTGTIRVHRPEYLVLSIPYSEGWTAFVDGKKETAYRADTMMTAVYLHPGRHRIELRYHTPWKKAGTGISLAALLLFLITIISERRKSDEKNHTDRALL